jgi:hypothetical protein
MGQGKKVVRFCCALVVLFAMGMTRVAAQEPIDEISDNSFLIEEAYNQEPGVVQHIFNFIYTHDSQRRGWYFTFTQEWPVFSMDHQFSYTLPFYHLTDEGDRLRGIGDMLLNYRYQLLEEKPNVPAFSPRFSLIVPTGNRDKGTGDGVVGYQWNLPFSKKINGNLVLHANLGITYLPGVRALLDGGGLSPKRSLVSYNLGASGIFALSGRVHVLLEWVGNFEANISNKGKVTHDFSAILSPGIRASVIDRENFQTVIGVGIPVGLTRPADNFGVFLYLSVEHKFF